MLLKEEMMMYSNKLAIAVKSNGKVLREFKDTVYVPFGSEYTLLIKNLNSVRAQVKVSIDGTDMTDGVHLVIQPNSEIELERSIKNGNMSKGNRFKFIERTQKIEDGPRGIKVEDGLIRIEYQFEKPYVAPILTTWPTYPRERWVKKEHWEKEYDWYGSAQLSSTAGDPSFGMAKGVSGSILRGMSMNAASPTASASFSAKAPDVVNAFHATSSDTFAMAQNAAMPKEVENENGITVAGSVSEQKFTHASWFAVEAETHVMVVKLLGETESGKPVVVPVTVKAKPKCSTCGHVNKAKNKFCSECGTSLEIV